ncbi:MAG TPA: PKD domain-containing protein [Blastocatellia bacterium]|nr:PKD domain-containing protein [Blastocatellia bacterium]
MNSARRILGLLLLLALGTAGLAQTPRSEDDPRNLAPTVNGGTGLFTVYDAQTLRRGEFNFGFFANFFHRDAGDARFQVYPANFQVGFNDYFEFFVNLEAQKVIAVGQPALLSGFYMPDVRTRTLAPGRITIRPGTNVVGVTVGDPCGNGGFAGPCAPFGPFTARPSGNNTAVYPGLGAPVGGILPAIPAGLVPNYLPNAPFLSRFVGTGVGDLTLGAKIRFTPPNNAFGLALIPTFKIPTTRTLNTGLQRGRGTGAFDYGLTLALDGRLHKHINLSANVGFIKRGDPRAEDMQLGPLGGAAGVIQGFGRSENALDLPNEWRSGIGVDFPLSQYLAFAAEITATRYVGSRTPMLLVNNPVDVVAGARIFPARWWSITAAYQRHLNWLSEFDRNTGSPDGFIAGLSFGHVNKREPAILPNNPPTISLTVGAVTNNTRDLVHATASTVCVGDSVAVSATASDPDGDTLTYKWTTTGGRIVGDGPNVTFDTTGLAPGEYTITCEVDDGCGCVAFDTKTIRVESCPPILTCFGSTLDVTPASTSDINPGEAVTFSTSGVSGGRAYGDVTYTWTASAGTITGNGTSARLDTTGVAPGTTINVTVTANSSMGNCSATGSATVTTKAAAIPPPRPKATEVGSCVSFKRNQARVDNACKDVLRRAANQLQTDPQAQLVIYSYRGENERPANLDLQRGKNARDRLADGGLGVAIDPNRIVVRPSGVTTDGQQLRIWFVPAGADTADMPQGTDATLGDVTPERRAAPARRPARRRR